MVSPDLDNNRQPWTLASSLIRPPSSVSCRGRADIPCLSLYFREQLVLIGTESGLDLSNQALLEIVALRWRGGHTGARRIAVGILVQCEPHQLVTLDCGSTFPSGSAVA